MKELALNILDIVQNSIRARAHEIGIRIEESEGLNMLKINISDNGIGIHPEMLPYVTDPFTTSRTKRKVGMGLSFLKQHAEQAGGRLRIESHEGKGTRIEAEFILNHIDRQPMGDLPGVLKILVIANPGIEFFFEYKTDKAEFSIDTHEIKETFEIKDLTDNNLMEDIKEMIKGNLKEISSIYS
jgi:DNA topoisomerase VI subunit B